LTTLYKINLLFRNGDTGYDEEFSITVASDNSLIGQLFAAVVNQPSNEGVKELLISMMEIQMKMNHLGMECYMKRYTRSFHTMPMKDSDGMT